MSLCFKKRDVPTGYTQSNTERGGREGKRDWQLRAPEGGTQPLLKEYLFYTDKKDTLISPEKRKKAVNESVKARVRIRGGRGRSHNTVAEEKGIVVRRPSEEEGWAKGGEVGRKANEEGYFFQRN